MVCSSVFPRSAFFTRLKAFVQRAPFEFWFALTLWLLVGLLINSSNLTEFNLQQIGVEAIVERGQFHVEGSPTPQLAPQGDVFAYNGHLYAAKQPGQFLFGALVYFFLHWLGITYLENFLLASALVTWFTAGLVTALASAALYRIARVITGINAPRGWAVAVAVAFALATTAFPYAGIAHHDALATGYLVGALYFVFRLRHAAAHSSSARDAALAGVLLGLTITTSMLPFFMVCIIALYFFSLCQWRTIPYFAAGGLFGLAPLLFYDWVNFGSPFILPNVAGNYDDTFFYLETENLLAKIQFYAAFVTQYAPLVWFGLVGWFFVPRKFRREQVVVFALLVVLGAYIFNIDTVGNCQYGPRYLLPAMPFAALGLIGFYFILARPLRLLSLASALIVGLFSFVVNLAGAAYGAMYCDLAIYAFPQYVAAALRANFHAYPLALWLALPFLVALVATCLAFFTQPLSQNKIDTTTQRAWFEARWKIFARVEFLGVIILLVAAFLRFYRLWELPPGLWIDEAFYGLDALRVLDAPQLALFFPQNGGREPLFIYLQAFALAIFGTHVWALRSVPVCVGIATVAAMIPLGRALFPFDTRGKFVGIVAAAALAVSFWHVTFSRLGLRAILLPLLSALVIYFFWRGWQTGQRRAWVWCGILLGVSLYTYLSARILPFVLVGFVAAALLLGAFARARNTTFAAEINTRRGLEMLGIVLGIALLVALPLGIYFVAHPNDFFGRAEAVALTSETASPASVILENAVRVGGMFFVRGDANPRHNLPNMPALDPLLAMGFVTSLVVGMLNARRQPVYLLLFIWLAAMLLPSVFSTEAPHYLRTLGALPPLMVLTADGLTRVWARLFSKNFFSKNSFILLTLLVLLFSGALTFRNYFRVWANLPSVYEVAFDTRSEFLAARILQETARANVLTPLRVFGRPALLFALHDVFTRTKTFDAETPRDKPLVMVTTQGAEDRQWVLLERDAQGNGTVYFPQLMAGLVRENSAEPEFISGIGGARVGQFIPLRRRARNALKAPMPAETAYANFENELRLVGYTVNPPRARADQIVEVAMYWEPLRDLERSYSVFVQVMDANGQVAAQWDAEPVFGLYGTGAWKRGAIITDLYPLRLPQDMEPGEYKFQVGWLDGNERLTVYDAQGREADDKFIFGTLVVESE